MRFIIIIITIIIVVVVVVVILLLIIIIKQLLLLLLFGCLTSQQHASVSQGRIIKQQEVERKQCLFVSFLVV